MTREEIISAILNEEVLDELLTEAAGKWMQKAVKRPGAFTAKARALGRTVPQHTSYVNAHPEQFDTRTKRQANLAKVFAKVRRKK